MVSFEEFSDIYELFYALGYAPARGLREEKLSHMYQYLSRTQENDSIDWGFPIMHLVDTLGEGVFNVFDSMMDSD